MATDWLGCAVGFIVNLARQCSRRTPRITGRARRLRQEPTKPAVRAPVDPIVRPPAWTYSLAMMCGVIAPKRIRIQLLREIDFAKWATARPAPPNEPPHPKSGNKILRVSGP